MKIINRQFIKEILKTSLAVLFILISIFLVIRMVGFLKEAAQGDIPLNSIFILLGYKLLTYIDVILPLIIYISILLVLNRWNKDNEMAIISAAGVSLFNFLKPAFVLISLFLILVAMFSLQIAPWAVRQGINIEDKFKQSREIIGVVPGVFTEIDKGTGVYFLESKNEKTGDFEDVFAYGESSQQDLIIKGERAYRFINEEIGAEYLVVKNGTRYDALPNKEGFRITDFNDYALLIKPIDEVAVNYPVKGYETPKLIELKDTNRRLEIEIIWRIAKIVVVPVLILFAVAFSKLEVRRSRMGNILSAFFMYFIYTNANTFVVSMLKKGTLNNSVPLWIMHMLFLLLAIFFLYRSSRNRPLIPFI